MEGVGLLNELFVDVIFMIDFDDEIKVQFNGEVDEIKQYISGN